MPSAKYSCSGSPDMFWNGKTATDGFSGSGNAGATEVATTANEVAFAAIAFPH
jgi:hypothetical protein